MTIADLLSSGPQKVEILTSADFGPPEQLIIDLASSEQHSRTVNLSDSPVENGADITDHTRETPASVTLSCVLANSFLDIIEEGERILQEGPFSSTKAKDAWDKLERFMKARTLVTITTDLRVYENMIITSLNANLSSEAGDSIPFELSAREVFFAESETVAVDIVEEVAAEPPKKPKADAGTKAAAAAPTDIDNGLLNGMIPAGTGQSINSFFVEGQQKLENALGVGN